MINALRTPIAKRLIACVFGGFVLALMIGNQEGSQTNFSIAFREAVAVPRIFVFLGIGLLIFVLTTFWPRVVPYLTRPGAFGLGVGLLIVVVAQTLMNWYDPLPARYGPPRFSGVANAASQVTGLSPLATAFFGWLAYTLMFGALVAGGAAIVLRWRPLGYLTAALGAVGVVVTYSAHASFVSFGGSLGPDHSLGVYADMIGFGVFVLTGLIIARSEREVADPRGAFVRTAEWRPGFPLAVIGLVVGVLALTTDGWFDPDNTNRTFAQTHDYLSAQGLAALATAFLSWLGWLLFALAAALALASSYLQHRLLSWVTVVVSGAGIVIAFLSLHSITLLGAQVDVGAGTTWNNLGAGGWMVCIAFSLFATTGALAATSARANTHRKLVTQSGPMTSAVVAVRSSTGAKTLVMVGLALALFYPPTLPVSWQSTIVSQIGVYVLLAIGLNVVVGWAGLLDLGYIAFYGIGSYTTAYFTGSAPIKPPHWLTFSPLWAIPFAIAACLIAGVLLGAPTLRLRGDYLAIVTLGFGEIMQRVAVNNPGDITGGPQGPHVPHPVLHVGPIHITWGLDNLPYWYLLLVFIVVIVALFYRLEGSRLGRAWAAIREDEVAAQATGINTARAKLLAFAIGASTSGVAGVFFATQVGYFDPSLFSLQASILIVAYVVFGGMGSLQGAMAGAAALTWLPQFLKEQVPADDRQMWVGALLLLMMIFRPSGLIPARRRKAELSGLDAPASSEVLAVPAAEGL